MTKPETRVRRAPLILGPVDAKYGAPMGRPEWLPGNMQATGKLQLERVRMDSGGYDPGGAYWGAPRDLWHAEGDLVGEKERVRVFTRAASRDEAKANIRKRLPNVRFYR